MLQVEAAMQMDRRQLLASGVLALRPPRFRPWRSLGPATRKG